MDTKELDRAINISQQIRIELIKNGMEATEELAHTMEILMCKTHDMISSFNSENTEGVSTTSRTESGVSHDVSDRNASRADSTKDSEVVVEGALALRTDSENICDHHWERVSRYNWSKDWRHCCKCEKWEQI